MKKTIKLECEMTFDIEKTDVVVEIKLGALVYKLFRMQKGVHYLISVEEGKVGQYYGPQERCLKKALDDIVEQIHTKLSYFSIKSQE